LDEVINKYEKSTKPALTVLIPEETFHKYGLSAVSLYENKGKKYAVSGVNIIDGRQILEEQEQEVIVTCKPEAVFNVNAIKDLEKAKNYLLRKTENER
jgi:adenosylcobinamide-phosphate guanylyltransferase